VGQVRFKFLGQHNRRKSKMEMVKIVWNYLIDVGGEIVPKKRYALLVGLICGGLAVGWWVY